MFMSRDITLTYVFHDLFYKVLFLFTCVYHAYVTRCYFYKFFMFMPWRLSVYIISMLIPKKKKSLQETLQINISSILKLQVVNSRYMLYIYDTKMVSLYMFSMLEYKDMIFPIYVLHDRYKDLISIQILCSTWHNKISTYIWE